MNMYIPDRQCIRCQGPVKRGLYCDSCRASDDAERARTASTDALTCPACGEINELDFCDGDGHLVTYWGDEDHDYCCPECEAVFRVRETVIRNFEILADIDREGE